MEGVGPVCDVVVDDIMRKINNYYTIKSGEPFGLNQMNGWLSLKRVIFQLINNQNISYEREINY